MPDTRLFCVFAFRQHGLKNYHPVLLEVIASICVHGLLDPAIFGNMARSTTKFTLAVQKSISNDIELLDDIFPIFYITPDNFDVLLDVRNHGYD